MPAAAAVKMSKTPNFMNNTKHLRFTTRVSIGQVNGTLITRLESVGCRVLVFAPVKCRCNGLKLTSPFRVGNSVKQTGVR